jgi:ribonuclease G
MNKEFFVSSTPHETKVGVMEDDQLAEIYLERENEYTLAGSIYKGRVTRVLPGMQSAFVDIGLERDAFLYVSDFMDLEQQDDDLDEVPTNRPVVEPRANAKPGFEPQTADISRDETFAVTPVAERTIASPVVGDSAPTSESGGRESRGGWRGKGGRRRRGRGDRAERSDRGFDTRRARPTEAPASYERPARDDFGPPPGYEPIVLPGESISKYQRQAASTPSHVEETAAAAESSTGFSEDEPFFAQAALAQSAAEPLQELHGERAVESEVEDHDDDSTWEQDEETEPVVSAAQEPFVTTPEPIPPVVVEETTYEVRDFEGASISGEERHAPPEPATVSAFQGTVEEEEIEEEEADLASYVEELEEDATFEELEEETRAAEEHREHIAQLVAAGEPLPEPVARIGEGSAENGSETEEEDSDELELEEAQAEAEALLAAESGNGEVRAELRAPAGTAGYTQRAQRQAPAFDRRRGRRGGGGRRFRRRENTVVPQISDLLKEGQEVLIQIAKEPIGKKGARITSHIALPGRFLVYMPTVNHTGVSRKISSDEERQRLKRIILSERDNGQGGFIVRTAASGASEEELRADIRFLKNLWTEIKTRSENSKAPALIYHDLNVVERVLRDQVTSDFSAIWVDTEGEYERILRFANRFQPALVRRVKLYTKETPLFDQFGLSEEINKALKSKVWLKSGGYIVINQTEALVAIDVNTGKYVGKTARLEDTIVKTNVDAIKEIVRQIRLRDLGGIIVIDFIDMDERRNRQKVMQALEEALRGDRAPSKVLQFNDFGLVAITRKRVKQSLERTIGMPCPYCESTGYVKSVNTVCNEIFVEMRKMAKHLEHADVMLRVHPDVAKALKAESGKWLLEMEELTKRTIIVKSDPAVHQEQFDIN